MTAPDYSAWFPPNLDPDVAYTIAAEWWHLDPHYAAAIAWEFYAATLPPAPSLSSVSTGAQPVSYSPAAPAGEYGAALARAEWHRRMANTLVSVPLRSTVERGEGRDLLPDMSWWVDP